MIFEAPEDYVIICGRRAQHWVNGQNTDDRGGWCGSDHFWAPVRTAQRTSSAHRAGGLLDTWSRTMATKAHSFSEMPNGKGS